MGAELGATCSVFPYTARMGAYLRATGRSAIAAKSDAIHKEMLTVWNYYFFLMNDLTCFLFLAG